MHDERGLGRGTASEAGFSLVEFMIAAAIMTAVLGGTVALATQLQQTYSTQLDDVAVEEEVRFALDWIARVLRSAGNNPYEITPSTCPGVEPVFQGIRLDPNANGLQDDVRVQADINPPNGLLVGLLVSGCIEQEEDITIAHDAANLVITRQDNAVDLVGVAMTEPVITELRFTYLDTLRVVTTTPDAIAYAQIRVTGRSRAWNPNLGAFPTSTLETEVRLRTQ